MENVNSIELQNLNSIVKQLGEFGSSRILDEVFYKGHKLPIYGLVIGSDNRQAPTLGLFGGVHGLERVGSHVVMNYLGPLLEQMKWDRELRNWLQCFRIVSIPIVNPGGMVSGSRSNPNGIDIMRNAPVEAQGQLKPFVSGHRYSRKLPWYRGEEGADMEIETRALIDFVKQEMLPARFSIALDVHSGFGMKDRLWYPYSRSREKFPYSNQIKNMTKLLNHALPFHVYKIEPQSESYMIHGDPWDYIFDFHRENFAEQGQQFLPLCLEMGSWTWLKKNPKQLFSKAGIFNPILPHRYGRIMRRHKSLLDFLRSAVWNYEEWTD